MSIVTPDNRTSYTIMDLIPNTNYDVRLSAFTEAGEGNRSVNVTGTTFPDGKYF